MTTNKQLREWLSRFPDDANIQVVTTEEYSWGCQSHISDSHADLILPDITMATLKGYEDFENVCFDVKYDYDKECAVDVAQITLGKAHND